MRFLPVPSILTPGRGHGKGWGPEVAVQDPRTSWTQPFLSPSGNMGGRVAWDIHGHQGVVPQLGHGQCRPGLVAHQAHLCPLPTQSAGSSPRGSSW